ncbi:MAG TPA: CBS domain-containing protein [Oceanithermus sp.]|nr:CBS domain-containing protein [Oceanithermus sp.]
MLVREWMTPDPVTISPDTPVLEAIKLLKEKGFRRLPIVEGGKLVGIVTDKDLKDAMPSKATTLSVWELNYLLSKLTVSEVMAKPVITVQADEPLEEAALLMEEYKVGGLPVLEGDRLVGMITITDVLRAFIEVMGMKEGGVRITFDVPDRPGALAQAAQAVPPANIVSVATAGKHDGMRRIVMRVTGEDAEGVPERLKAAGEIVVDVRKTEPRL